MYSGAGECGSSSHCLALLRALWLADTEGCHRISCNVPQGLPIPALHHSTACERGTRAFPGSTFPPSSAAVLTPPSALLFPCYILFLPIILLSKQQFPSVQQCPQRFLPWQSELSQEISLSEMEPEVNPSPFYFELRL